MWSDGFVGDKIVSLFCHLVLGPILVDSNGAIWVIYTCGNDAFTSRGCGKVVLFIISMLSTCFASALLLLLLLLLSIV